MPKFFVNKEEIGKEFIKISDSDAKHLIKVLRKNVNDDIIVCDGCGFDYDTVITSVADGEVTLKISERRRNECEPDICVTIYQAVPKGDKMETVIQKCTELGAYGFVPFINSRVVVKGDKQSFLKKQVRWQKIADEAVKQCMRGRIPEVSGVLSFDEMLERASKHQLCIMPYELCRDTRLKEALGSAEPADIGIIIGSEGGFSEEEVERAKALGIIPVTLGKRILRTETAGAAVLACTMYHMNRF